MIKRRQRHQFNPIVNDIPIYDNISLRLNCTNKSQYQLVDILQKYDRISANKLTESSKTLITIDEVANLSCCKCRKLIADTFFFARC